jgi:tetratricopeptide (TPR) repeat protein
VEVKVFGPNSPVERQVGSTLVYMGGRNNFCLVQCFSVDETAIQHYTKASELDDEDISYLINRAAVYIEMGKYDECIKDCDKAVERGRELRADFKMISRALTRKGTALVKLAKTSKDFDIAIETFQKALTEHRNPDRRTVESRQCDGDAGSTACCSVLIGHGQTFGAGMRLQDMPLWPVRPPTPSTADQGYGRNHGQGAKSPRQSAGAGSRLAAGAESPSTISAWWTES